MTPTDQSPEPQLTRRQLREIRMTGATPIVTPEEAAKAAAEAAEKAEIVANDPSSLDTSTERIADAPIDEDSAPTVRIPRAALPIVDPEPVPDMSVELGERARTRRQAREQERLRTASIPVVTPAEPETVSTVDETSDPVDSVGEETPELVVAEVGSAAESQIDEITDSVIVAEVIDDTEATNAANASDSAENAEPPVTFDAPEAFSNPPAGPVDTADVADEDAGVADAEDEAASAMAAPHPAKDAPVLRPSFGAELLENESFDDLVARGAGTSGSSGSSNALILDQSQTMPPLTAPVTSTGQIILTGTFALPDGLGSQGHAPGVADGKEVDAVLIDGELPAQSSPTPIAATAAVSQAKTSVEMIRPAEPEKTSKLIVTLAIIAGVLAIGGIATVAILAMTGKF